MNEHTIPVHDNRSDANGLQDEHHLPGRQPMLRLDSGWRAELHARRRFAGFSVSRLQSNELGNAISEERRVGKECRSRWLPSHLKKKIKRRVCVYINPIVTEGG